MAPITKVPDGSTLTYIRLIWFGFVFNGFTAVLGGAVLPEVILDFHLSPLLAGIFIGLPALGKVIAGLIGGFLTDMLGIKRLLVFSVAGLAVSLALNGSTPNIAILLISATCLGIAIGLIEISGNIMIAETYKDGAASELNRLHFFFGVGAFACPTFVAILFSHGLVWRSAYLLTVIPVVVLAFFLSRQPALSSSKSDPLDIKDVFRAVRQPALLLIWVSAVLLLSAEQGISGWITTYMRQENILRPEMASIALAVFWIAMLAGRLMNTRVPVTIRYTTIIIVEAAGCAFSLWITLVTNNTVVGLIALGFAGLFMAGLYPTLMAQASRLNVASLGLISGIFLTGVGTGEMSGPIVIGLIAEKMNLTVAMNFILVLLLGLAFIFIVPRKKPGITQMN